MMPKSTATVKVGRNRLLSIEAHEKLASGFTAVLVMTPWIDVVKVDTPASVVKIRNLMEKGHFDQIGVENHGRVGLIRNTSIEVCDEHSNIDDKIEWITESVSIPSDARLIDALKSLTCVPSKLVVGEDGIMGLLHRSDFNKQAVRTYFYLWLSALEMGMAEFILREFPDHNDWIPLLREAGKERMAGHLDLAKKMDAELSAIEYVELSDLADVVKNSNLLGKELWKALKYESKSKWDKAIGRVIDLRNKIMHPVRTLVFDTKSAKQLVERDFIVKSIVKDLVEIIESQ